MGESIEAREKRCAGYVMSWVTPLNATLLFGPVPRTFEDMWYLTKERNVTRVVDLRVDSRGPSKHYRECVDTLALPLAPDSWTLRGRLKDDKLRDKARKYVEHAAGAVEHARGRVCYVHGVRGNEDEAYVAFALRVLLGHNEEAVAPSKWLRDNGYETVLDNTREKLELLDLVWQEARARHRAAAMFAPKRTPTLEAEPKRARTKLAEATFIATEAPPQSE
jgi:hypothetical protein